MKFVEKTTQFGGRKLTLSTGKLAPQANAAVLAQYGDTVVLATIVANPMKAALDYFPLSVEYQERLYAGGRIKGSRWVKREGRGTEEEILKGRLIDRSIRPLFPKEYKKDVQVIITVLSVDLENDPIYVAPIAVSAAIAISTAPWEGPVAVVNVGLTSGSYLLNPRDIELPNSEMDLTVSFTKNAIVMIEAGAKEVTEDEILGGIAFAQKEGQEILTFVQEFADAVGTKKDELPKEEDHSDLVKKITKLSKDVLPAVVDSLSKVESGRSTEFEKLVADITDSVEDDEKPYVFYILDTLKKEYIRENILKGKRPDGRAHDEIRKLSSEVGILPRTHGSAVFQRGATQVLNVATLGAASLGQLIETAEGEEEKRYIHHYSMPPYSTGETGRVGSPSRREIGHGALAERALQPVIPSWDVFPYAIRVVSEVLSSNGSTSMASTCASTLSLMDAGVPISAPVSGIAMGLVVESAKKYAILSDIAGIEDFNGDMDFKVAGTEKGITALQLDVKTLELTLPMLKEAVAQAKVGRKHILDSMIATIAEPRANVSIYAPKIKMLTIDAEKIGAVIGAGGKTIKKLMSETNTQIDIEDDGSVSISGVDDEQVNKAIELVEGLTKEVEVGEIYTGVVKRIQQFGAFVEFLPGKEGLVRIEDLSEGFVQNVEDVVKEGQEVQVRVKEVDMMHRVNLSMILDPSKDKRPSGGGGGGRDFSRPRRDFRDRNDRGGDRGGSRSPFRPRAQGQGGQQTGRSGPHFPTSRLMGDQGQAQRTRRP